MTLQELLSCYLEMIRLGELPLVACTSCRNRSTYPRASCTKCGSGAITLLKSEGRGRLYSFTIVYRAAPSHPDATLPFVVALIELEEGIKIRGNISSINPSEIKVGMPLKWSARELTFVPR